MNGRSGVSKRNWGPPEAIAGHLKTADIAVRPSRGKAKKLAPHGSKPANGVTTDFGGEKPASLALDPTSKPVKEVIPGFTAGQPRPKQTRSASQPYRELIEQA